MKFLKSLFEWIVIIVVAFVLSLVIRNFVIDTRIVPTGSMLPTIQLDDRLIVDRLFYKFDMINRGDIVVFKSTKDMVSEEEDLVKRVIGLPGEEIQIKNGKVFVNGKALYEPYIAEAPAYEYGPVTVPPNSYFMLGDNRNDSKDSHIWGFVDSDLILGRVWIRYWPLDRFGKVNQIPPDYFSEK